VSWRGSATDRSDRIFADFRVTYHVDNNIVDDPSRAAKYLRAMAADRRTRLYVASTGWREAVDRDAPDRVVELIATYPLSYEVGLWGESHRDVFVAGSPDDTVQLEEMRGVLAPSGEETVRSRMLADALHVQTAARSAATGFVARDHVHQGGSSPPICVDFGW
jgi:hypothetical protein